MRIRRIAEEIRAELSQILREEVRDPRVGLVTLTRVKLASDFGTATVFFSPLVEEADEARTEQLEEAMASLAGFARRLLAGRLALRHTPELRFVRDDSIAEGAQTLDLIRSLEGSREAADPESGEEDGETKSEA